MALRAAERRIAEDVRTLVGRQHVRPVDLQRVGNVDMWRLLDREPRVRLETQRLVELRDRWLSPPEWVDEPGPGYPKRPVPRDEEAVKALKKRTLTNLCNARPQWLADAHDALDGAVAAAYGWSADISDDDVLRELLALNGRWAMSGPALDSRGAGRGSLR